MALKTTYSGVQIGLHWAIALLIAANYFISDGMGDALDAHIAGQPYAGLTPAWHVWAGTALLVLVLVRLIVRAVTGAPALTTARTLASRAADVGHWALYALMLAVPTLGALTWFGQIDRLGNVHVLLMNVLMVTILAHSAIALFHHFILRDGLLYRMIPFRKA